MDFNNKIAVVTGGAQGIGRCIAEEFRKAGATVCVIDKQLGDHFVGDLANKDVLERFAKEVIAKHGRVVGLSSAMALDGHTIIPLPTKGGGGITYVKRHRQCHS